MRASRRRSHHSVYGRLSTADGCPHARARGPHGNCRAEMAPVDSSRSSAWSTSLSANASICESSAAVVGPRCCIQPLNICSRASEREESTVDRGWSTATGSDFRIAPGIDGAECGRALGGYPEGKLLAWRTRVGDPRHTSATGGEERLQVRLPRNRKVPRLRRGWLAAKNGPRAGCRVVQARDDISLGRSAERGFRAGR